MAQLTFIKFANDTLTPITSDVREFLHFKIKLGTILSASINQLPSPKFRRKYSSLLNICFDTFCCCPIVPADDYSVMSVQSIFRKEWK
ncbi:DUF1367 family protein [Yersinia mollaretii]|uniref:DUF1367 family protein n=1 Tax=Yersinia mollaretii TaxID=33060 RepID=UPI0005E14082|nr:DUF1367 family protein [Yersinia mollaretii]MDN0109626.1 DUF1367 family protein [Yersinia mollaretii]PJE88819.1 DUF1367 domain-containing protein [Yersinia mollaretii]CQD36051.1 Protein of uncharacterised function (DUF1367) [Yersinia mollaretii]CQG97887.1 Protein of uncharacterised function (DUF1367) [Yersinia mollaretii]